MRRLSVIAPFILSSVSLAQFGDPSNFPADRAFSLRFANAQCHHELQSTALAGSFQGEHLIASNISIRDRNDNVITHRLWAKVTAWGVRFAVHYESADKRTYETFAVTLHEMSASEEMKADFEHVIYERGVQSLKFSGTTTLVRWH
jgi:hypothetical protein